MDAFWSDRYLGYVPVIPCYHVVSLLYQETAEAHEKHLPYVCNTVVQAGCGCRRRCSYSRLR